MSLYWKFGLALGVFAVLVSGCLMYGRQEYRRGEIAATARISAELAKSAAREQANKHAASQTYQHNKARDEREERVHYVEVEKIVEKPVYRGDCLDDDGVRIINEAIAHDN